MEVTCKDRKTCSTCLLEPLQLSDNPCNTCDDDFNHWIWKGTFDVIARGQEAPIDCGPGKIEEPQKRAPSSFRITWFDADLTPLETKIQGVELILTDLFGNWVFYGEVVEDLRKLIFLVNAEHLVSITRLDAPVA
jgi:hypothetical protein